MKPLAAHDDEEPSSFDYAPRTRLSPPPTNATTTSNTVRRSRSPSETSIDGRSLRLSATPPASRSASPGADSSTQGSSATAVSSSHQQTQQQNPKAAGGNAPLMVGQRFTYDPNTGHFTCACHGKTYRRKGDLDRHMNEAKLPAKCDGCGMGFPRKDPRIRHWDKEIICEVKHHVKNIGDSKEKKRWEKRWVGREGREEVERLVMDEIERAGKMGKFKEEEEAIAAAKPGKTLRRSERSSKGRRKTSSPSSKK